MSPKILGNVYLLWNGLYKSTLRYFMHCWTYRLLTRVTVSVRTSFVGKKREFSHLQDVAQILKMLLLQTTGHNTNYLSPCILPIVIGRIMARGKDF